MSSLTVGLMSAPSILGGALLGMGLQLRLPSHHLSKEMQDLVKLSAGIIAIGCNLLVGYGSRSVTLGARLLPILPLLVAISLMFIADIDAPRHGIIRVKPQNLLSLAESLDPNWSKNSTQNQK